MTTTQDTVQRTRAKERTNVISSLLSGAEEGATAELEKLSLETEEELRRQCRITGSKATGHAADVLKAQRLLVSKKDLGDRLLRITKRLEDLKTQSETPTGVPADTKSFAQLQQEIESLRPLLRLLIRSDEFRSTLISFLRVGKHVLEQNMEGSVESALETGESEGIQAATHEVQEAMNQTMENIQTKVERNESVISDQDWETLKAELDDLFHKLRQHYQFRSGIKQLFNLASTLPVQLQQPSIAIKSATEGIRLEAKDLVAQFSGEQALDKLVHSINKLMIELESNAEAKKWWTDFKDHTLHVADHYSGKEDLEKYRQIFYDAVQVFKEYRPRINHTLDCMNIVLTNITNDELVIRLKESLATLQDDLFWEDQDGNRYFDAEASGLLASSITDVIRNQFKYLALPRIVRVEENRSYSLDNIVITATLPDVINFHLESDTSINTTEVATPGRSSMKTEIYLAATIRGITAQVEKLRFTYEGSTLNESGVMSVRIPPPGANLLIEFIMRPSSESILLPQMADEGTGMTSFGGHTRYEFLRVKTHFSIPDMDIEYDTSTLSHQFLVPLMTSFFKGTIIDRFESGIEESLDQVLLSLGQRVTDTLNQAPNPLSISSLGSMVTIL